MASNSSHRLSFQTFFLLFITFSILLQFCQISKATPLSFCPLTLSRPTCPDLPTYDAFDITTYGGRWFEIGSSANFKNLQESGGICVVANYSLLQAPTPGRGAVVGVVNTLYSLGAPFHNVSQVVISLTAGQICSQAFSICAQVDETNSNSSLAQGLALVCNVTRAIDEEYPSLAANLVAANDSIEETIVGINLSLDQLSKIVSRIQVLNSRLGQGQGNATTNVAALIAAVTESNDTTVVLAKAVGRIEKDRENIEKVASKLLLKGDVADSVTLGQAVGLIFAGQGVITAQLAQIQLSLASVVGVSGLFLTPSSGQKGYNGRIVGTALQDASFAGKLEVTFPSFPPGNYWVLAVDGKAKDGGYAATLVYGCDQNQGSGIEETLFVLSRTPSLPADAVQRLLDKAATLGVTGDCSTPFIFTVQSKNCGNPPSDILPFY